MTGVTQPRDAWVENVAPTRRWPALRLAEPWQRRELLWFLAVRDVKVRYKQAALGVAWAGLQPVLGAVMFMVLFHELANVDAGGVSYFAFALVGFVGWSYFSSAVTAGTASLLQNPNLITKVPFPRIIAPLSTLLPGLINLVVGALLAVAVALVRTEPVTPARLLLVVPGVVLLVAATTGPVLVLSAAVVRFRDVAVVVTFTLQLLLFATPVGFPPELVPGKWRTLLYVNPVSGALGLLRGGLIGMPLPAAGHLALSSAVAVGLLVAGLVYFRSRERTFADVI